MKQKLSSIISTVLFCTFMVAAMGSIAQKKVPELWGLHVHDEAHVLSPEAVDRLERELSAYEDSTSNQLAILIIPSLDGEVIEQYALRVAESWSLGQADKDNGALLVIAVSDRKMRIETGQGLEGPLTDAVCSRIIRNEIAPPFRQGAYDDGVTAGIKAMVAAIGGEYAATGDDAGSADLSWKEKIVIGLFIFIVLGIFTVIGILAPGCAGWFLYVFLIPFYAVFSMVVVGSGAGVGILITYLIAFPLLKVLLPKTTWGNRITKSMSTPGKSRGGRWSSGSGWGGWTGGFGGGGGSSSSGGGGFSGGGGSFGGGGSSGSW